MNIYRTLASASLAALLVSGAAVAQQGAPGGSLYKDPEAKSYAPPRTDANKPVKAEKRMKNSAKKSDMNTAGTANTGTTNGDGASIPGQAGLTGPKFGGG